jgi:ribosome biogenesis GTPase / thiamine phosphate phosphatase
LYVPITQYTKPFYPALFIIPTKIFAISNVTGQGMPALQEFLAPGKTYCLLGSSGVGKSTLINQLSAKKAQATQAVSHTGEGKHTTVRRELIVLPNGAIVIDYPGMRELA